MSLHVLEQIDPRVIGNRLQLARKDSGLTQQAVADKLDVARTTVTAIEKGDRKVKSTELVKLARLFECPVSDFVGKRNPSSDFSVHFRALLATETRSDDRRVVEKSVREFRSLCEDFRYLERVNGAEESREYPTHVHLRGVGDVASAAHLAAVERDRLGLGVGPIYELRKTLEIDVGLRVFLMDLPSSISGMFSYSDELGGCVAVNRGHPPERQRWTMAHEFAHFLTRRDKPEISRTAANFRKSPDERFADDFARNFLMPTLGVQSRFSELYYSNGGVVTAAEVCRLAHYYFTSVAAMMLRLEELKLIPKGTWDDLKDRGFKVRNAQDELSLGSRPHDDQLLPESYQYLAVRAHVEEKITEGQLARILRLDRVSARELVHKLTNAREQDDQDRVWSIPIRFEEPITR